MTNDPKEVSLDDLHLTDSQMQEMVAGARKFFAPTLDVADTDESTLKTGPTSPDLANPEPITPPHITSIPPEDFLLIRHGDTKLNAAVAGASEEMVRGHQDVPLAPEGRAEAERMAEELKDSGIQTIVSSDLDRALETAQIIGKAIGATVLADSGLRPWHFGPEIEGKKVSEVRPKIHDLVDTPDAEPKGGESLETFKSRFLSTLRDICAAHPESLAIVAHHRADKLLDAWDSAGREGDEVDPDVMKEKQGMEPGSFRLVARPQTEETDNGSVR